MTDEYTGPERRKTERIAIIPHPHTASEPCPGGCKDIETVTEAVQATNAALTEFEQRLQEGHDQLTHFEGRLAEGDARMGRIEKTINANSAAMTQNSSDTSEILQIMKDTKVAFKMIGHIGTAIKWISGIVVAVGSIWLLFRDVNK